MPIVRRSILTFRGLLLDSIRGPTPLGHIIARCRRYYVGSGKSKPEVENLVQMRVRHNLRALADDGLVRQKTGNPKRAKRSDVWVRI